MRARYSAARWARIARAWEDWKIPVGDLASGKLRVRFVTDSYSRAGIGRGLPGNGRFGASRNSSNEPRTNQTGCCSILPVTRQTPGPTCDSTAMGGDRPFDGAGEDSSGASWYRVDGSGNPPAAIAVVKSPDPPIPCVAAFTPYHKGLSGLTIAEYEVDVGTKAPR